MSSLRSPSSRRSVLKNRDIIMACVCNSATLRICFSLHFAYSGMCKKQLGTGKTDRTITCSDN
ncbi:hypothetical protein AHAS_Ahas02G0153400 [Arachis hypogaea]